MPEIGIRGIKVVAMRDPSDGSPLGANAQLLLDHWNSLPKHDLIPRRADLDPAKLRPLLGFLILAELNLKGELRLRLVGTNHVYRWGRDLTGGDYLQLLPAADRPLALARARLVLEHPCGCLGRCVEEYSSGAAVTLEFLRLPMRDEQDKATRLIIYAREIAPPLGQVNRGRGVGVRELPGVRFIDIGNGVPAPPG
jgi:hypothetical protein